MNVYDKAHELAKALKESSEFTAFKKSKELITDGNDKKVIDEFRKKQLEAYQEQVQNGKLSDEMKNSLQILYEDASKNPKIKEYLMSEERFGLIWADIMKILTQAVEIDDKD